MSLYWGILPFPCWNFYLLGSWLRSGVEPKPSQQWRNLHLYLRVLSWEEGLLLFITSHTSVKCYWSWQFFPGSVLWAVSLLLFSGLYFCIPVWTVAWCQGESWRELCLMPFRIGHPPRRWRMQSAFGPNAPVPAGWTRCPSLEDFFFFF